jgi:hypothetical protein
MHPTFARFKMKLEIRKIALLGLLMFGIAACGIKPDEVEPPEEVKSGEFPRNYPDLATDPPPYVRPN